MWKCTVTERQIEALLETATKQTTTIFGKMTLVTVQLANGFCITESSACVDPQNYDEELGEKICMERIANKLWELEGYAIQQKLFEENQSNLFNFSDSYTPVCPAGFTDCVCDPAYIKHVDPDWYKELYGDKTPEEAAKKCHPDGHFDCKDYDDEDK